LNKEGTMVACQVSQLQFSTMVFILL
jgi:hypothetical protein